MRLHNFQCFKDSGDIPIHRMTIFIGENDSGKSCLLRALEYFYLNKPPEKSIFHSVNGQCETTSSIVLTFRSNIYMFSWDEIPGKDSGRVIEFLAQKFGIDWIKIAKIEKIDNDKTIKVSTEKNSLSLKLKDEKTEVILEIDDGRTNKSIAKMENDKLNIIFTTGEEIPKEFNVNGKVTIKKEFCLEASGEVKSNLYIEAYLFKDERLNTISLLKKDPLKDLCAIHGLDYTTVDDSKAILSKFVEQNFESLDKTVGWKIIKWTEVSQILPIYEHYDSSNYGNPKNLIETTLRDVYKKFFMDYDEEGNESLKPELIEKRKEIYKELDKKIQESLKPKLASIIGKIKTISGEYSIDFSSGFSLSNILVDYGQGPRSINDIGEGSKKRLFLAIMEWNKEMKAREPHKAIMCGYDEPDASLHYSAQKEMYYTLWDLSSNVSSNAQVSICTHSISMIDRAPARIINHIKQKNGVSFIETLKSDNDNDIKDFLESVSEISGIRNSSLFFERCFVVIEGETEHNALPTIYKKLTGRSLFEDGVVLINVKGNSSWESFLKLLNKNKRRVTILFLDKDIQNYSDRKITLDKLKQIGFDQDFLINNVILVGKNEFEDIFSNELICKCLNSSWPKLEGELWKQEEIEPLRSSEKFSEKLIKTVRTYRYENFGKDVEMPNKPEFGKKIADIITIDEIKNTEELSTLIEKIKSITD